MTEFRRLLAPLGEFIRYERDRAGLDLGLHLYEPAPTPNARPGQIKVWFQVKGIEAATLSADDFDASESIAVASLPIGHIQYWYAYPEPVYLAVYVEAHRLFLAEDVNRPGFLGDAFHWGLNSAM
jgi:hypothetical protein